VVRQDNGQHVKHRCLLKNIKLKVEDIGNASKEIAKEFKEVDKRKVGY